MKQYADQENFTGNGKHLKVLLQAVNAGDMAVWNEFAKAQGPGFSAHLSGISLPGAHLVGAWLAGARLDGANLEGADLSGANLLGASLKGANVKDMKWEKAKVKVRVRTEAKAVPMEPEDNAAVLRRQRVQAAQRAAQALLEEKKKKETRQKAERQAKLGEGKVIRIEEDND